ncbi:MAG: transposase [Methylocella sp.]
MARLVVAALGLQGKPRHLALDAANWRIGKTNLNILVLSVAYDELCVPLFWRVLDKVGNSNAAERIDLMQTFKDTFQNQPVASLTGDREFIGNAWIAWLQEAGIPHFSRACVKTCISSTAITRRCLCGNARPRLKRGERMSLEGWWRIGGSENNASPPVRIVIPRLDTGELLTIACRNRPKRALAIYRKRWKIETLFAALKKEASIPTLNQRFVPYPPTCAA